MPNLKHLISLKRRFSTFNQDLTVGRTQQIIEAFDPSRIEKSFSFNDEKVSKYVTFFKSREKVNAVLLFIDITAFSLKFESKTADQVVDFLDNYYKRVFPIVAKHGGEIEKIIGDGIIVVLVRLF